MKSVASLFHEGVDFMLTGNSLTQTIDVIQAYNEKKDYLCIVINPDNMDIKRTCSLTVLMIVLCGACKNNKSSDKDKAGQIHITSFDNKDSIKASTFVNDARIIKLETNDDCLIQHIFKVQYLNHKIYILDILHNDIFIFNGDGSFDKKLSKKGIGPGEYIQIADFYVCDQFLYVMDYSTLSILKYNSDLTYIDRTKYNALSSQFVIRNDQFWIYNEPTDRENAPQFTCLDQAGNESHYLPRKFCVGEYTPGQVNAFSLHNERIVLSPKHGNIIYQVNNNTLEPIYEINFHGKNFPENENVNDHNIYDDHFAYVLKGNFQISDKYLIFDYFHNRSRHFCFYDIKDKNYSFGLVKNDLLEAYFFAPRWGNDNYLIDEIAPFHLIEHFPFLANYNEQLKHTTEDDNPILILYRLK